MFEDEGPSEWDYRTPTIADAHSDYHAQNGWGYCPLDCAGSDPYYYDEPDDPDEDISYATWTPGMVVA